MVKSFYEILAEEANEYSYKVHSTADIHNPERFARIRMSLYPYQIRQFEASGYIPWSKGNNKFPNEPNSPVYTIKVSTSLPLDTHSVVQTMAMLAHINSIHLLIEPDDDSPEVVDMVTKPNEVKDAQESVGDKRIGAFIKELSSQRDERMKRTTTREVYESYTTTQLGLEKIVKKPLRKGYYMVETYKDNGKIYLHAQGPFESRSENDDYRDMIKVSRAEILSEGINNGNYDVNVLIGMEENYDVGDRMFEVKVKDTSSNRHFSTLVRASESKEAIGLAIRQVGEEHKLDPKKLIATFSKPTSGSGSSW
jgi:hypothetical protein